MGSFTLLSAAVACMLLVCRMSTAVAQDNAAIAAAVGTAVTKALSAAVTAANGPSGSADAWQSGSGGSQQGVNVTLNGGGLNVDVRRQNGSNFKLGVGSGNTSDSLLSSFDGVTGDLFNILMPWLPQNTSNQVVATSGPVMSAVGMVRSAARQAIGSEIADKFNFVTKQSDLIKETISKEISDYITAVNGASTLIQALIKNKGKLLTGAAGQLGQGVMGMRSALTGLAADGKQAVQDKVEGLAGLAGQFRSLATSMLGDMGSTAGLLVDAAGSKAKAFRDVYTTSEGLAKAHVDATVQTRANALNSLLDKVIAGLNVVESAGATGPVIDFKLQTTQMKLKVLETALDKVAAAVKAAPTPSQVFDGKLSLLGSTRIGQAITNPDAALEQVMGKIGKVRSILGAKGVTSG